MSSAKRKRNIYQMVLAAMLLAMALELPLLTGQIPQIGKMLCPMHLPVLLCGYFCGPWYGLAVGAVTPFLRMSLVGQPTPILAIGMTFELAAYGFFSGYIYRKLPKNKINIYLSLIAAMLIGRIVWGAVRTVLNGLGKSPFGWAAFVAGAFTNALPGIILQLVLIPVLVMTLRRFIPEE